MKRLLILGAGTAGTIMANHLNRKLDKKDWKITIVDEYPQHYYQPGFLFIPFGTYTKEDVVRDKVSFLPKSVEYIQKEIDLIEPEKHSVRLKDGVQLDYHILIVATGAKIVPDEIEGLSDGWGENIFDFYTIEGSMALAEKLKTFEGGKLVVHLAEMPIKCPVAPLEFTFLVDWFLHKKGIRKDVDLTYVTPLSGAFTKPNCSQVLGYLLKEKNINLVTDYNVESVDAGKNQMLSYDGKTVDYDLLVTVPTNMGDPLIARSGMGDDLDFIPTDKHTLRAKSHDNIFVIGDATDVPASKAGSVAHFQAENLTENIMSFIGSKPMRSFFDGHANCFIESGFGKAFLIDFNYDVEPMEGAFPLPVIGPFGLLKESRLNHLGKLAFRWIYWNVLLKGYPMPLVSSHLNTMGKKLPDDTKRSIKQWQQKRLAESL